MANNSSHYRGTEASESFEFIRGISKSRFHIDIFYPTDTLIEFTVEMFFD